MTLLSTYLYVVNLANGQEIEKEVPEGWRLLHPNEALLPGDRIAYYSSQNTTVDPVLFSSHAVAVDAFERWAGGKAGYIPAEVDAYRVIRPIKK